MSSTVYFLSDVHVGAGDPATEAAKERDLVDFLRLPGNGDRLYLLGDVFDFWYDFDAPPPDRYTAVLRALRECTARGVAVAFMGGNHDWWARVGRGPGWLERAIGVEVIDDPHLVEHQGRRLLLTHGDALGGADGSYRFVRWVLHHPVAIRAFGLLPPRLAYRIADRTSGASRSRHHEEMLEAYRRRLREKARARLARGDLDAILAGHVHHPERTEVDHGVYLNLGDWVTHRTYARLRDGELALETFRPTSGPRRERADAPLEKRRGEDSTSQS
ncbi:MAG: UDP-2,3-diacylglucosamine diphosphatase [Gemmatimonadota bacterium]|nr:UDP-2,3-diacylglucosamine diphosphatase [Gemmatimonadota bacterium]